MGVLNFEIVVEEEVCEVVEGKSIRQGYVRFITITISHEGKKTVVHILANENLDKPYLHEVNANGIIKAINTR
jgi:hypothetical protein